MCTVSFYPKDNSYIVGMNRDELLTRGPALPPQVHRHGGGYALHPTDAEGGTWIGLNDAGVTFALLNWNSPPKKEKLRSRGHVVLEALAAGSMFDAEVLLHSKSFVGMNPYRLIGFFPRTSFVREWRWDGANLTARLFPWCPHHWFSSGLSDEQAAIQRGTIVESAAHAPNAGSLEWLRELHSSHQPKPGAFSVCVHREDAATLSYTEISVEPGQGTMRYRDGSPCLRQTFDSELSLELIPRSQRVPELSNLSPHPL